MIEELKEYEFEAHKNGRNLVKRRPVYIRKLCDALDNQQAVADVLDCARATVSRALTENSVTGIYEVAAEAIYKLKYGRARSQTFIVQVPGNAMEDFTAALDMVSGVRVLKIPEGK